MGRMRIVSLKIDDELYELLQAYVITHKTTKSEAVRRAIRLLLEKEGMRNEGES